MSERPRKPRQTVNTIKKNSTIKRYIHYYTLLIGYRKEYESDTNKGFMALLKAVIDENNSQNPSRFFLYDGKTFCVKDLTIRDEEKIAFGKLCTIRSEDFPQVFNMKNGDTRDFDAKEFEGIVEYTHFIINYKPREKRIGIEYNQYGGKVLDLVRYFTYIGANSDITNGVGQKNVINDNLSEFKDKIGRVSKFVAKVSSSNIEPIKSMEPGLGSVLDVARDHFSLQDVQVEFKFDYKHMSERNAIAKTVDSLIGVFSKNPLNTDYFLKLTVDAEKTERENKIQAFDLLADKVRSELIATKDGRNRTVVSNELLQNMIVEMKKLKL